MRILNLVVVLSSVLLLAACSFEGNRPMLSKSFSEKLPTGYYGQNSDAVPEPSVQDEIEVPSVDSSLVVVQNEPAEQTDKIIWNNIDHYNAKDPMLSVERLAMPLQGQMPASVKYGTSVTVYPIDGNVEKNSQMDCIGISGEMVQQIFFEHGSARISRIDSENLRKLAKSLVKVAKHYKLSVIGHASSRVDHVTDIVRKKIINLKMAQRRADAVRREFYKSGVKPDWILVTSSGDMEPNLSPGNKSQEASDRRVEVYIDDRRP
ncbi:MAG: OmpA family protein [Alphaproteobacteria bacterium]|nr:OmpA family protein [Alphaproteobacteria bacterium]